MTFTIFEVWLAAGLGASVVIGFWIAHDILLQRVTQLEAMVTAHQALLAALIEREPECSAHSNAETAAKTTRSTS